MNEKSQIRELLLKRFGLRVQPEMSQYVLERLADAKPGEQVAIIGGDVRTGIAVRQLVAAQDLCAALQSATQ